MCNPQDASCPEPEHPQVPLGFPRLATCLQRGRFDDLGRGSRPVAVPALIGVFRETRSVATVTRSASEWKAALSLALQVTARGTPIKAQSPPSWVEPGRFLSHAEQTLNMGSASSDCAMCCRSDRISRHPCQWRLEPEKVVLEDLQRNRHLRQRSTRRAGVCPAPW